MNTIQKLKKHIEKSIDKLKSPTRLDFALKEANGTMFTEENGDRPGVPNVLVVSTDGRTHDSTDFGKFTAYIQDLKVTIIQEAWFSGPKKHDMNQMPNGKKSWGFGIELFLSCSSFNIMTKVAKKKYSQHVDLENRLIMVRNN